MRLIALALALGLVGGYSWPIRVRDRSQERDRTGQFAGYTLTNAYEFTGSTVAAATRYPPCTAGNHCVALCKVNAGGTAWECVDSSGGPVGTVTQGTGTTYAGTFAPGVYTMTSINGAKSPSAVMDSIASMYAGDMTIMAGGFATTSVSNFGYLWSMYDATTATGMSTRVENGTGGSCGWTEGGVAVTINLPRTFLSGWSVVTCRRSGNDHVARHNGTNTATTTSANTHSALTAGTTHYFGGYQNSDLYALGGQLAWVAYYSVSQSDAWVQAAENGFWGSNGISSGVVSYLTGADNTAASGQVDVYQSGASMVTADGLVTLEDDTNFWAADPLDVSSWTNVGTPTVNTNVASGPFSRWKNTAEVDRLVDADGAAFVGKQSDTAGTATGWYTASCYVAAGDTGTVKTKARLVVTTDATGSKNCDFSNLTASYQRLTCTTNVTGTPTYVKGQILEGNATTDTGSILVSQCQLIHEQYPGTPMVNNITNAKTFYQIDASGWPNLLTTGAKFEVVFVPAYSPVSGWLSTADTIYTFDSWNSIDHGIAELFGYSVVGRMLAVIRTDESHISDLITDNIDLTPGQAYAVATAWKSVGGGHCKNWVYLDSCGATPEASCHATTLLNSDTTGTAWCPNQVTTAILGNRFDATVATFEHFSALRVYTAN